MRATTKDLMKIIRELMKRCPQKTALKKPVRKTHTTRVSKNNEPYRVDLQKQILEAAFAQTMQRLSHRSGAPGHTTPASIPAERARALDPRQDSNGVPHRTYAQVPARMDVKEYKNSRTASSFMPQATTGGDYTSKLRQTYPNLQESVQVPISSSTVETPVEGIPVVMLGLKDAPPMPPRAPRKKAQPKVKTHAPSSDDITAFFKPKNVKRDPIKTGEIPPDPEKVGSGSKSQEKRTIALSDRQLNEYMHAKVGQRFKGVPSRDQIPLVKLNKTAPSSFIFNTANSDEEGLHWCACYVDPRKRQICYYDSFGVPPHSDVSGMLTDLVHDIHHLPWQYKINGIKEQHASSHHCGHHSARFLTKMHACGRFKDVTPYHSQEKASKMLEKDFDMI